MSATFARPAIIICGPTATGKSDLAQDLAESIGGEVLSADSMQVYRGMDIGTAKIPPGERRVPHHGLDLTEPDQPYSAALYQRYARDVISRLEGRETPVVMAGGTGLYLQAVVDDLRFPEGEQVDNPVRAQYEQLAEEQGAQAVWEALQTLDAKSAAKIHPNNLKRTIRALEMHAQGERYADRAHGLREVAHVIPSIQIGLTLERSRLYERIDERVDKMREAGLVEEVEALASAGFAESLTARQAIGYKEVLEALTGRIALDEAFDQIKRASRRYAKRQMTWFRRDERIHWLDIEGMEADDIACAAEEHLARMGWEA